MSFADRIRLVSVNKYGFGDKISNHQSLVKQSVGNILQDGISDLVLLSMERISSQG